MAPIAPTLPPALDALGQPLDAPPVIYSRCGECRPAAKFGPYHGALRAELELSLHMLEVHRSPALALDALPAGGVPWSDPRPEVVRS